MGAAQWCWDLYNYLYIFDHKPCFWLMRLSWECHYYPWMWSMYIYCSNYSTITTMWDAVNIRRQQQIILALAQWWLIIYYQFKLLGEKMFVNTWTNNQQSTSHRQLFHIFGFLPCSNSEHWNVIRSISSRIHVISKVTSRLLNKC